MRSFDEKHIGKDLQMAQVGVQLVMRSFDEEHIGNDLQTGQVGWKVVSESLTRPPPHHGGSCLAQVGETLPICGMLE